MEWCDVTISGFRRPKRIVSPGSNVFELRTLGVKPAGVTAVCVVCVSASSSHYPVCFVCADRPLAHPVPRDDYLVPYSGVCFVLS